MKNHFRGVIYALRRSKGLTQAQLGAVINVSETAVSKWERGMTLPDIGTMCVVAAFFQVSLDELLGREKKKLSYHGKYTEEQMQGYEISLQCLKCCESARQYGLLAMEEITRKEQMDEFLVFCVQFILNGMHKQMSMEKIFIFLENYARVEIDGLYSHMIVAALQCIVSGESEEYLKELLASYLGKGMRSKLLQENISLVIDREAILSEYSGRIACVSLLEELCCCTAEQFKFMLKNLDETILIHALAGASGEMCIKFLANLSDRMLCFWDKDIRSSNVSYEQIKDAQRQIVERAVGWNFVMPEKG